MLSVLARAAMYGHELTGSESEEDLRQLGYSADLARGRVKDPGRNLEALVSECRLRLQAMSPEDRVYRDPAQARWGALWNMDVGKLKTELPLHVMKLEQDASRAFA